MALHTKKKFIIKRISYFVYSNISVGLIKNIEIKNIRDNNFFDNESLKKIYNLQENKFTFGMDKKNKTHLGL